MSSAKRAVLIGSLMLILGACGRAPDSGSLPTDSPTVTDMSPSPSLIPSPTAFYGRGDLEAVMPTAVQTGGWQTATRSDLSGPYTPTSNTNSAERPTVSNAGFEAGQRLTIGMPGAPGIDVVRVSAEVYQSSELAASALIYYQSSFATLGYSTGASAGSLPSSAWALMASDGFIAPQFAMGTAPIVFAFGWRIQNLVVVVRAGGDPSATNAQALEWAALVNSNIPKR
jgi:hypothetical protein